MYKKCFNYFFFLLLFILFSCNNKKINTEDSSLLNASEYVTQYNDSVYKSLNFINKSDYEFARKGFLAKLDSDTIFDSKGNVVYNSKKFNFVTTDDFPSSVNPILWRQAKLNSLHGLFQVTKGIYQVRGYDIANITFIEGKTGWIVIDPLTSKETSAAALDLINKTLGARPVKAILFTHSHTDHFGGVNGIFKNKTTKPNIPIIAPQHFFEEALSENLTAGYHMGRRAQFMYGSGLNYGKREVVSVGLNQAISNGTVGIIKPNYEIKNDGQKLVIDGIDFIFQLAPNAEAPSEFMFYLPQYKAFCHAEEMNQGMHNLYTPRGAKVRDGLLWSKHINHTLENFGDKIEVSFGSHFWPVWGNNQVKTFYENQRDLYKYIHDQTLNFANKGYGPLEIADKLKLPKSLDTLFYNKGVYGNLKNNVKAQYQLYYGWFDGNPSNLDKLPPKQESFKMIEYMGGEEEILKKAQKDYNKGEYRFVATALGYLVEVNSKNKQAKELLAKTFTQLAYMAESGPVRNFYLSGANELKNGLQLYSGPKGKNRDFLFALPDDKIFDAMSVALNGEKASGERIVINFNFTDSNTKNTLYINNGVLNYTLGKNNPNADISISMNKETFAKIALEESSYAKEVLQKNIKIKGNLITLLKYSKMVDKFNFDFPLVLPMK